VQLYMVGVLLSTVFALLSSPFFYDTLVTAYLP
jgi:hypothetical protein